MRPLFVPQRQIKIWISHEFVLTNRDFRTRYVVRKLNLLFFHILRHLYFIWKKRRSIKNKTKLHVYMCVFAYVPVLVIDSVSFWAWIWLDPFGCSPESSCGAAAISDESSSLKWQQNRNWNERGMDKQIINFNPMKAHQLNLLNHAVLDILQPSVSVDKKSPTVWLRSN